MPAASLAGDRIGVTLRRPNDRASVHVAALGRDPAGIDRVHRSAFVDVGALPAHDLGETEHEARRMNRSAVTEIQRTMVRRHREARPRFVFR